MSTYSAPARSFPITFVEQAQVYSIYYTVLESYQVVERGVAVEGENKKHYIITVIQGRYI